jgi:hypothetical protein
MNKYILHIYSFIVIPFIPFMSFSTIRRGRGEENGLWWESQNETDEVHDW